MRVLIVDDSMAMRRMLAAYVEPFAAGTSLAEDGVQALERLEQEPPFDVALVDWDMPRLDGLQFVRRVRADARFRSLKLVMVTAHVALADVQRALADGADDYVMKPVSSEMLEDKLRMLGLVA